MTQEVQITITGEFDARLSKAEIQNIIETLIGNLPLNVSDIKEEAEIYKLNELCQ